MRVPAKIRLPARLRSRRSTIFGFAVAPVMLASLAAGGISTRDAGATSAVALAVPGTTCITNATYARSGESAPTKDTCTVSGSTKVGFTITVSHSTFDVLPWCPETLGATHPECVLDEKLTGTEDFQLPGGLNSLMDVNLHCPFYSGGPVSYDFDAIHLLGPTTYSCMAQIASGIDDGQSPTWVEMDINEGIVAAGGATGSAALPIDINYRYVVPISGSPFSHSTSGVDPAIGPVKGGESVHVSGSGLASATTIELTAASGAVLAKTRVESASAAGLNFSAPDLTAELHAADDAVTGTTQIDTHVVALSAGGAALGTTGDGYTASAPVVTSVVRPSAPVGGGVSVTVGGRFFSGAVAVDFQDRFGIVSARVSVVSDSKLVFTTPDLTPLVPPGTSGPFTVDVYVRVNVTNSLGGSIIYSNGSPFTVQPIAITAVSPFAGPVVGKTPIIVSGTGLSDVTELEFIATSAAARAAAPASFVVPVKSAGASTITVNTPDDTALAATPAGRVEFDIVAVAKTPSGTVESARTPADRFSYKAPMIATLSSGSPAISAAGGTSIVISGEYFQGVTEVVFEANGHDTEVAVSGSPKSIVVTSPDLSHELGGKPTMSVTVRLEVPVTGTHTGYYVRSSNMSTITMKA